MSATIVGLLIVLFISTLAAWLLSRSKNVEKLVKVMLFALYFWLFAFVQLIIFAILFKFGLIDSLF